MPVYSNRTQLVDLKHGFNLGSSFVQQYVYRSCRNTGKCKKLGNNMQSQCSWSCLQDVHLSTVQPVEESLLPHN